MLMLSERVVEWRWKMYCIATPQLRSNENTVAHQALVYALETIVVGDICSEVPHWRRWSIDCSVYCVNTRLRAQTFDAQRRCQVPYTLEQLILCSRAFLRSCFNESSQIFWGYFASMILFNNYSLGSVVIRAPELGDLKKPRHSTLVTYYT